MPRSAKASAESRAREDISSRWIVLLLVLASFSTPLAFSGTWIPSKEAGGGVAARLFVAEFQWSKAFLLNLFSSLLLLLTAWRCLKTPERAVPAQLNPPRILLPTLLFLGAILLGTINSLSSYKSFYAAALVSGSLAFYLVLLLQEDSRSLSRALSASLGAAGAAVALFGLLQHFQLFYLPETQYGRRNPGSFFGLTNFASEFLLIPFPISVALAATARKRWKVLSGAAALLILTYLIVAETRAVWLAVAFQGLLGLVLLALRRQKGSRSRSLRGSRRLPLAVGLIATLLGLAFFLTDYGRHVAARAATILDPRFDTNRIRLLTWQATVRIFRDHPIAGVGLANAELFFPLCASPELEVEYLATNTRIEHVHNEYLQVLAESGVIGFLALGFLIVSLFRLAVAVLPSGADGRRSAISVALVVGIAGVLAAAAFSFPFRNPASALSFWIAVALLEREARAISTPKPPETLRLLRIARGPAAGVVLLAFAGLFAYLTYFSGRAASAERHYQAAKIFMDRKEWAEARRHTTEAIAKNPRIEAYFHARGLANLHVGESASAVGDLERATVLAPFFERAYFALAVARYRSGDLANAVEAFLAAQRLMPSRTNEILHWLVDVYLALGDGQKAIAAGREAVRLDPQSASYRYSLARAYLFQKLYFEAESECRAAIALKPGFSQASGLLAQITSARSPRRP